MIQAELQKRPPQPSTAATLQMRSVITVRYNINSNRSVTLIPNMVTLTRLPTPS
jgi:hypothetical protein